MPNYGPVKKAAVEREKALIVDLYYKHGKTMQEIEALVPRSHGFVQAAVSAAKVSLEQELSTASLTVPDNQGII